MPIRKEILTQLASNDPRLTKLDFTDASLSTEDLKDLLTSMMYGQNIHVTVLILSGNSIENTLFIHYFAALQNIEVLGLGNNKIEDEGIDWLTTLPKLRKLDLGGNNLGNTAAEVLAKLPLVQLQLYGNKNIHDAGAQFFLNNLTLTKLALNNCSVSCGMQEQIEMHIAKNSNNQYTFFGMQPIFVKENFTPNESRERKRSRTY